MFSKCEENGSIFKLENSDHFSFTNSLEEILMEKQLFGLIMVREMEKADKQKDKEARLAIAKWLKSNKHLMSKYCVDSLRPFTMRRSFKNLNLLLLS